VAINPRGDSIKVTMWKDGSLVEVGGKPVEGLFYAASRLPEEERLALIEKLQAEYAAIEARWR